MSVQMTSEDDDPATASTDRSEMDAPSISKDDAFHLAQNARRRAILRYLLAHPETERFSMRTLAEEIAAWEHDTTVEQLDSDQRQRVYIALYQSHLPKLDDHDIIEYNQARGIVTPRPLLQALRPLVADGLDADAALSVGPETGTNEPKREQTGIAGALSNLLNR